ncbi:MAG TPA: kynureninase [Caulobacteraceae bacterium]|nr:kynureninase [Caulobacteraceae bacterium]
MDTLDLFDVRALDAADPMCDAGRRFVRPQGLTYLDGNSLGAAPTAALARMQAAVAEEWGGDLVRGWNGRDWIGAPARIGGKIARLIGAQPNEVIVADSTSVNIFKLLVAALKRQAPRRVILSEPGEFPTDLYVSQGVAATLPGVSLRLAERGVAEAIDETVAVVLLTHVHYRTSARRDLAAITAKAREAGALVLWDLSHSAGALQVDLAAAGVELAVGCGYKYLNGGPGAPAWLFVAEHLQSGLSSPLSGWMGHDDPFEFGDVYRPATGMDRFLCGTPPVLSMLALECGVDQFAGVDMAALEAKTARLTGLYVDQVEGRCAGHGLQLITPRQPEGRGAHVSFTHPAAFAIVQALIARDVIGDFRAPDVLRFGFAPLYTRYEDVWRGVEALADVLETGAWKEERFQARARVT